MMSTIAPFIQRKVVVLHEETPAYQAVRAMCDNLIGSVVVVDRSGKVTGIVTDRDLACSLLGQEWGDGREPELEGEAPPMPVSATPLSEVMSPDPVLAKEDSTIQEIVGLMEAHGIRRIPIIGKNDKCVGVVTLDDLIASASVDMGHLARIVQSQIVRRRGALIQELQTERAEARSEAHMEQTVNHFFNVIAEKTGLDQARAEKCGRYCLEQIVQRLHYTGAAQMIAQLPHRIQDDMLDLPAGPNRDIGVASLVQGLATRLGSSEEACRETAANFWKALGELIDPREREHILAQLPEEMRVLFGEARSGQAAA